MVLILGSVFVSLVDVVGEVEALHVVVKVI